jgi:RNA polymerase sigma-70 factor, ECF subfamily
VRRIYAFVRARVPDDATAEDLTAQIFFKAMTSSGSYRGEGSYRSWIFQIARNTVATWHTHRHRLEIPTDGLPDDADDIDLEDEVGVAGEERDVIRATVAELPAAQREVVSLHYWKQLDIDEIAQETRRSQGAVRQLLLRARRRLRRRLSEIHMGAFVRATGASARKASRRLRKKDA